MKGISILKNTTRSILLAGLMCGIAVVHAQTGAGGGAGGAGQAGAGGSAGTAGQAGTGAQSGGGMSGGMTGQPYSAAPGYRMEGKKGSKDSSSIPGSGIIRQSPGMGTNPLTAPGTPGT